MPDEAVLQPVGFARCITQPSLARRVVAAATETLEIYHGHARGRATLWVHAADDDVADRAIRVLADHRCLHIRHAGHRRQSDFAVQRPGG